VLRCWLAPYVTRTDRSNARPCGFSLLRTQMRRGSNWRTIFRTEFPNFSLRFARAERLKDQDSFRSDRLRQVVRVGTGGTDLHATRPTHPSRASPPSIRGLNRVIRRRVLQRGVPLPAYRDLRGPVERDSVPPRFPSNGAHGVLPFAGLIPPTGDRDISARPGPHVVRAFSFAPIDFRRGGRDRLLI
jgi:hypothetical protein